MIITPIPAELGRFMVQSESNPDQQYLVDVMENLVGDRCVGKCGCHDHSCRRQPKIDVATEVDDSLFCKHVVPVMLRFGQEMAASILKDQSRRAFTKDK